MAFSLKQVSALRRNVRPEHICVRQVEGRELSYLEAWHLVSEANRIFGFDGWNRETVEARCVLARENKGMFTAVYLAKVRITVRAQNEAVVWEAHGSGGGRAASPAEAHE